jgi:hypothetical protein
MECVYADEVARRRQEGLNLAEVSCLADRRRHFRGFFPVFAQLSQLMAQHARRRGLDELLVAVHPRHARFYQRFMAFERIGEKRAYPTVKNHPAVALSLNFDRLDRNRPKCFSTFFGQWLPEEELRPRPISSAQREFFRNMVDPAFRAVPLEEMDDSWKYESPDLVLETV